MKTKSYKCYSKTAEIEVNPVDFIKSQLGTMNLMLKYLSDIKPDILEDYTKHLTKRIKGAIESIEKRDGFFDFPDVEEKYEFIDKSPELRKLTKQFLLAHLNPMKKSSNESDKYLVYGFNHSMAFRRISYHRVKTFFEMLGKEEGLKLYSKIITSVIEELSKKKPQNSSISIAETRENQIKSWCEYGMADFICCELDEHKIIYRFDICFAHEVLKDFNDPDIAYYASCYPADLPIWNNDGFIHMRRQITLHHGDFCDELYWDSRQHQNPKQPSLDFLREMKEEK